MSEKKTGGPAFPCKYVKHAPGEVGNNVAIMEDGEGMTLRDYFAAQALTGLLMAVRFADIVGAPPKLPKVAFEIADTMIKARES